MTSKRTAAPSRHPQLWERQARPAMAAIAATDIVTPRAIVVGTAGSGKSSMLRELRRMLDDTSAPACVLSPSTAIRRVPSTHVLLIDDLHLLDDRQLAEVGARAEDPDASLVVASRPWPRGENLLRIARNLERDRPAIVLGHLSRSDVLSYLDGTSQVISDACVDELLDAAGGITWLVSEALALHDARDCADGRGHGALLSAVEERVGHRLATVPEPLRHEIEALAVSDDHARADHAELISQGYAEGLLACGGELVPIVRSAVRAGIPDSAMAAALVRRADRVAHREPGRAAQLYSAAAAHGVDPVSVAARRARAAWSSGDLAAAGAIVDEVAAFAASAVGDDLADAAGGVWASRAVMRAADAAYCSARPQSSPSLARATIAALGAGRAVDPQAAPGTEGLPTTLAVALELLERGLRATVAGEAEDAAIGDLVRAAELYTASGTALPIPELPAVIAAQAAMNTGRLETARTVIDAAVDGGHGGGWARRRLLLWQAFIAIQRSRPIEARESLGRAMALADAPSPRDRLLEQAVRVAIARRYDDAAVLASVWPAARDTLLLVEADLYLARPLAELATAAARLHDSAVAASLLSDAIGLVERLGSPPVWSAHLRWAGIQEGILLNQPGRLAPHAKALVAASSRSEVAAVMAQAGRVWTKTLAGSVDADAIERAAHGLATAGLGWDGARLAGHGASRATDRREAARLLACARELHPIDGLRRTARTDDDDATPSASGDDDGAALSERETDVARLVLEGKTYAEIGRAIFISPRTVEHHVAHVKRRLGATSRSEMLAKLRVLLSEPAHAAVAAEPGGADVPPP